MNDKMELNEILDETIKRGYPELLEYNIKAEYKKIDCWGTYEEIIQHGLNGYVILINSRLKSTDKPVKMGLLASELSHIAQEVKMTPTQIKRDETLYTKIKRYRILDERNVDIITILRGFGKELYAFTEFVEREGYPHKNESGLSLRELKTLLGKK